MSFIAARTGNADVVNVVGRLLTVERFRQVERGGRVPSASAQLSALSSALAHGLDCSPKPGWTEVGVGRRCSDQYVSDTHWSHSKDARE